MMRLSPDDIIEMAHWDYFWIPEDVKVTDRPELLFLSCPRDVPILNTVCRTRAEPRELPDLVDEVIRAHSDVRSRWLVREIPGAVPLKKVLASAGYAPALEAFACAIDVTEYVPRPTESIVVRRVLDMPSLLDCVAVSSRAFQSDRAFTDEELAVDLKACTVPDSRVRRFVAYDGTNNEPLASGGMTLFPALDFGLLWAGGTIAEARGRGAYSAVLRARILEARELGFQFVGLYALTTTSAPIVLRQGFRSYGAMSYWERTPRGQTLDS